MTQTPPPGWYADPHGNPQQQRWWDGARWTEHVQPLQERPAPVIEANPSSTTNQQAKQWAVGAHLSALLTAWLAVGFIGPLVVYLMKKDEHPFIRQQAAEALNFNLSMLLYAFVGLFVGVIVFVLTLGLAGFVLIPVLLAAAVAWLVLVVYAATKASNGEPYRYPLTIRFVD